MKMMTIDLPDGSKWGVPVDVIAKNRATHYAHEFDGNIERSLVEDTGPRFDSDNFEIEVWASNNMNWEDVQAFARKIQDAPPPDFQEAWVNGEKSVIDFSA